VIYTPPHMPPLRYTNATRAGSRDPDLLRAAFRELHGRRLHGFALLVSLGDRAAASQAASNALFEAEHRLDELEHPERAAAWLRTRVLDGLRRGGARSKRLDEKAYRASLHPLGVALPVARSLARLSVVERAAVVASDIERLDPRDVATVLRMTPTATARLVRRAREAYLHGYVGHSSAAADIRRPGEPEGPLGMQVRDVAGRTLTPLEDRR
jgi:DNA-directed RNA polymerase specialized sigma24 family protein